MDVVNVSRVCKNLHAALKPLFLHHVWRIKVVNQQLQEKMKSKWTVENCPTRVWRKYRPYHGVVTYTHTYTPEEMKVNTVNNAIAHFAKRIGRTQGDLIFVAMRKKWFNDLYYAQFPYKVDHKFSHVKVLGCYFYRR